MSQPNGVGDVGPGRILIVDDEPLNVDYLEQELEQLGYLTDVATNGLEALERVAASPPDLVLLDVMMPELDGIATLRILKGQPESRFIPIVLMTALNAVEDRVRGIEAGADDFLSKPVDDRELLARIATAIRRKRAIDDTMRELHTTSAHLERFGRQERALSVLAVELGTTQGLGEGTRRVDGLLRRERAEEHIGAHGGLLSEGDPDGDLLVAAFDGPEIRRRAMRAVDAALAVISSDPPRTGTDVSSPAMRAAVTDGTTMVGSSRIARQGRARWVWLVDGDPAEHAATLARGATAGAVLVPENIAAALSDRYVLEPVGGHVYAVAAVAGGDVHAARPSADRHVTTILVTDIVGSTSTLERVGDHAGSELLAAHEAMTREELVLHGGEEINMVGDGFLASFDSPTRAIRCGLAIVTRVRTLGIVIRAGVHTGELEHIAGTARGLAMHVAVRIAARAAPGEVMVSATTRDLAAGAGLRFVDRGEHRLKGLAEPRQLYAAVDEPPASTVHSGRERINACRPRRRAAGGPDRTRDRRAQARRHRPLRRRGRRTAVPQRAHRQRSPQVDLPQGGRAVTGRRQPLRRGERPALSAGRQRIRQNRRCAQDPDVPTVEHAPDGDHLPARPADTAGRRAHRGVGRRLRVDRRAHPTRLRRRSNHRHDAVGPVPHRRRAVVVARRARPAHPGPLDDTPFGH